MGKIHLTVELDDKENWMYGDYYIVPLPPLLKSREEDLMEEYSGFKATIVRSEHKEKGQFEK